MGVHTPLERGIIRKRERVYLSIGIRNCEQPHAAHVCNHVSSATRLGLIRVCLVEYIWNTNVSMFEMQMKDTCKMYMCICILYACGRLCWCFHVGLLCTVALRPEPIQRWATSFPFLSFPFSPILIFLPFPSFKSPSFLRPIQLLIQAISMLKVQHTIWKTLVSNRWRRLNNTYNRIKVQMK